MSAHVMRVALAAALGIAISACDSGPEGPGALAVVVTGPAVGGAVLTVSGSGIESVRGLGSTRAYGAALVNAPTRHRVALIDPVGGELRFELQVQDLAMDDPVITVASATGTDNSPLSPAVVEVRIQR
jgi:hypothetical protein